MTYPVKITGFTFFTLFDWLEDQGLDYGQDWHYECGDLTRTGRDGTFLFKDERAAVLFALRWS